MLLFDYGLLFSSSRFILVIRSAFCTSKTGANMSDFRSTSRSIKLLPNIGEIKI